MKKIIQSPDFGLLVFRLVVGLTMGLTHGLGKVPPSEQLIAGVAALGFPAATVFAWCAALSELVGGLLLAAGFYTRAASFFLGFTMSVAFFRVHAADPLQIKELALLYLTSCTLLFFQGAGRFSLDRWFRKV